jgi:hypothetical protein
MGGFLVVFVQSLRDAIQKVITLFSSFLLSLKTYIYEITSMTDNFKKNAKNIVVISEVERDECLENWPSLRQFLITSTINGNIEYKIDLGQIYSYRKGKEPDRLKEVPKECTDYFKNIQKKNKINNLANKSNKLSKRIDKNILKLEEKPALENSPVTDEKPVLETSPITDENPVLENSPVTDEKPVLETSPVTDENPVLENSPVTDEKPVLETSPVTDENPVLENSPITDEKPVLENSTLIDQFFDIQEKISVWKWKRVFDAVVGSSHLKSDPPTPCQDSALAVLVPRPMIFVSDGAGSARLSHFGSDAVVRYLNRFCSAIEDINHEQLDCNSKFDLEQKNRYARMFVKYAIEILEEIADERKDSIELLKCTLLLVIYGKTKLFWLKVGDGFIIIEKNRNLELLGPIGKGEFANQTSFLTKDIQMNSIHYGFIDSREVTGIIACTDGAGEKLVSNDGSKIAGALTQILQKIRENEYTNNDLHQFLSDPKIWIKTTGDDKGISILSSLNH